MEKKYSVVRGFAAVGEDNVKKYFSPGNAHEIGDLPDSEIKKHVKAGNIVEYEENKDLDIPLESAPPVVEEERPRSAKKKETK